MASQTHAPASQRWPAGHAREAPHRHTPAGPQVSAVIGLHATQVPPLAPQVLTERATQVAPAQHPAGQDWASHRQDPLTQLVPAPHAGPVPHRHDPVTESHWSADLVSQATHA